MVKPIIVQKIIFLAVLTLSGLPPDVKKKKAAIIIIKGTRAMAIHKMKSITPAITSSIVSHSKGFGKTAAFTKTGDKKEKRIIKNIIFLKQELIYFLYSIIMASQILSHNDKFRLEIPFLILNSNF